MQIRCEISMNYITANVDFGDWGLLVYTGTDLGVAGLYWEVIHI